MFKRVNFSSSGKGFPHFVYDANFYDNMNLSFHAGYVITVKELSHYSMTKEKQQSIFSPVNKTSSRIENVQSPNSIDEICDNLDNLDFLNEKSDELREKEMDGHITEFEKYLLYEVIEKEISKFPNPHLSHDHQEAMEAVREFRRLEKQLDKKK